jgi:outer membrane lipoprotein carrier protein
MRAIATIVIAGALGAAVVAQETGAPSAQTLAARIQAHYTTVRDFTADFTLSQTSGLMPKAVEAHGEVKVKKPSRMRWTYQSADKQVFVSDGTRFYSYFPLDKYVTASPLPKDDDAPTALMFIAGRGDLTRDFTASVPDQQPAGEWRLLLTPKSARADFKTLTLDVDRDSLALRGLTIVDDEGGGISRYRFQNLHENRGLSDREFEFTIPKGVELR